MTINYQFNADAKTVFEKLTSPDFLKKRCDIQGEIKVDCKVSEKKGITTVVLDRTIRRDLPSILAKMFNPENRTIMTENWKVNGESYQGDYEIEVKGQPVTLYAKFKLENNAKGSMYSIDHSCKARVPLVGKHVEKFVIGQIAAGFNKEMDILAKEFN